MKKLIFILFLFPVFAFSQTSATMQFAAPVPGASTDSIRYFYPGKVGGFGYFYSAAFLRAKFLRQADSARYATAHALAAKAADTAVLHKTGNEIKSGNLTITGSISTQGTATISTLNGPDLTTANGQGIHLQNGGATNLQIASGQYADISSSPTGAAGSQKTIRFEGDSIKRLSDGKKVLFEGDAQQLTSSSVTTALGYTPVSPAALSGYPSLSQIVQNQTSSAQSANAWINGSLEADGGISVKNGSGKQTSIGPSNLSIVTSAGKVAYMGDAAGDGSASFTTYNSTNGSFTVFRIDATIHNDGSNQFFLGFPSMSTSRTINYPDANGTLVVDSQLPIFDTAPSAGSSNGITSGAVYTALQSSGGIYNQNSTAQIANSWISGSLEADGGFSTHGSYSASNGSDSFYSGVNAGGTGLPGSLIIKSGNYSFYTTDHIIANLGGHNISLYYPSNSEDHTLYLPTNTDGTLAVTSQLADMVTHVSVPISSTSTGVSGQIAYDSNYIYICYANNAWARFQKDSSF